MTMTDVPRLIIVSLKGGLGNQMFQYACGFALSRDSGLTVKVATDMFDEYFPRYEPELDRAFLHSFPVAEPGDMRGLLGYWRSIPKIRKWLQADVLKRLRGQHFVAEHQFRFNEKLPHQTRHSLYLEGYWQSEHYFKKHADLIRKEFTFKNAPTGRSAEFARKMRQGISVSLHVRRGDYENHPRTRAFHGLCEPEYYIRAIEYMRARVPKFLLYAFSDDPQWLAGTLKPRYPEMVIVNHNSQDKNHIDMLLMSLCDHHIIANSTFSWWGAWLNPDLNKIVIAPRKWFANGPDTEDLIPENWVRL